MGDVFTTLDLVIFFAALIGVMSVGLIVGRKEETSEDYFLAGRKIPWWGVAGSIFGSNVSANHMVGMMGIGFSIGFAQSHFELGAVFGLLMLCFGFLPVYRALKVYTLSEYLGRRYDDRSRIAYAIIMIIIMAVVQMVPALYIGARSICVLLGDATSKQVEVEARETVGDRFAPPTDDASVPEEEAQATKPPVELEVDKSYYAWFVIALAVISAAYTIFGGLKAVIWTDMIQSVLLLVAGIAIAILTFREIGGWSAMIELDQIESKMRLYRPSNHPDLPWTGVLTGLMAMHCFYWGTNQFIVQRALAARSDSEARLGIIAAGFLKLLIPFFAISAGVAAYYLFQTKMPERAIAADTAFSELVKLVVAPFGYGIIGLISAGLIGAILSSIDSMMNSAATIVTFDVYKRFINPEANDRQMIRVGRLSIVGFVVVAAVLAIFVLDPNSKRNFFLQIADYQNYLTPGLLVAFLMGMFWRRATGTAAIVTIVAGIFLSWVVVESYDQTQGMNPAVYSVLTEQSELTTINVKDLPDEAPTDSLEALTTYVEGQRNRLTPINRFLGPKLNFFHRVVGVIFLCIIVNVVVSLMTRHDPEKGRLVWADLGGHSAADLRLLVFKLILSIAVFALFGCAVVTQWLAPPIAATLAAAWTLLMYSGNVISRLQKRVSDGDHTVASSPYRALFREDRFWAGVLCATAVFMHFYFY